MGSVDREFVRQRIRDEEREMAAVLGIRTSQRAERRQRRDFYIISRCITANMVWAAGYASAYLAYPVDPPMLTHNKVVRDGLRIMDNQRLL
jgi:hypothetical protein